MGAMGFKDMQASGRSGSSGVSWGYFENGMFHCCTCGKCTVKYL